MTYDQGYWHQELCEEQGLDEQFAGTHIAVYVRWCIERDFLSEELLASDANELEALRDGRMSSSEYFENRLDWKFGEWNLNDEGNAFTRWYYDRYVKEVQAEVPSAVLGPESGVDFAKLYAMLDERLRQFEALRSKGALPGPKPWWKFW